MSLKFPISLVGKRASSSPPVYDNLSILYNVTDNVLAEIDGDIPDNFNKEEVLYNPSRLSIGSSCTSIGSYAFGYNSSLTELDPINPLPSTLTSIGGYAFIDTPITGSIFLPSTLSLGAGVFYGTNITDITIEMETLGDPADGYGAFEACDSIESVTLLDSCKNIYGPVFYNTSQFTLDLGSVVNLGTIGAEYGPFEESGVVGELSIPNTVEVIGDYAFGFCRGLTGSLVIPDSVTSIGNAAFDRCAGFNGSLTIGNSVTSIGNAAFDSCAGLTGSLVIPNSVTSIGRNAFGGCTGFNGSLVIPNSVTSIGRNAFGRCTGFNGSLTIGNSVTSIGNAAFDNCAGLTGSLVIPNSVTSIGSSAFGRCTGFNGSLVIPDSVTSIGSYAFYFSNFSKLVIPASVTSIGERVFQDCNSLTAIYTNTPAASWTGSIALFNTAALVNIYEGPDVIGQYTSTFQGGSDMTVSTWTNYPNI